MDLPRDYSIVAPNYAKKGSELAKSMGLGRKSANAAPAKKKARGREARSRVDRQA